MKLTTEFTDDWRCYGEEGQNSTVSLDDVTDARISSLQQQSIAQKHGHV